MATFEIPEIPEIIAKLDEILKLLAQRDEWLTKDQFCDKFNLASETVLNWRKTGKIPTKKIGGVIFVNANKVFNP